MLGTLHTEKNYLLAIFTFVHGVKTIGQRRLLLQVETDRFILLERR